MGSFDTLNSLRAASTLATAPTDGSSALVTSDILFDSLVLKANKFETKTAIPANNIDLSLDGFYTKTITALTTFTLSNIPTTGKTVSFVLELTNPGAFTITWFSGIKWGGGTAPTLTASGVDILGFYSHDGGTTWRGMVLVKDSK